MWKLFMKVETIWILLKSFIFLNCFNSQVAAGQNFVSIFLLSHASSFATIGGQSNNNFSHKNTKLLERLYWRKKLCLCPFMGESFCSVGSKNTSESDEHQTQNHMCSWCELMNNTGTFSTMSDFQPWKRRNTIRSGLRASPSCLQWSVLRRL